MATVKKENTVSITQAEEANWLAKADHHYLAARLLHMNGLIHAGEENAAFAIELILKCSCKARGIQFNKNHKLGDLWNNRAKPPFNLDNGYIDYLERIEKSLITRHPDSWNETRSSKDELLPLDFLYLKLRKWVCELIPEEMRTPTELDFAKNRTQILSNITDKYGGWPLSTILRRSNNSDGLL